MDKSTLERVKKIAEKQYKEYLQNHEDAPGMIKFSFEGVAIVDPFLDETGMSEVCPVEYYGEAFLNSPWKVFNN